MRRASSSSLTRRSSRIDRESRPSASLRSLARLTASIGCAALPRPRPDPAARVALASLLLNILDDSDFRSRSLLVACNKVRASLPAGIQTRWRVLDAQLIAAMGVPSSRTTT